jgi:hypothetical protein
MSMLPFLDHVEKCTVCRRYPRDPCSVGRRLFEQGSKRLTEMFEYDPKRAKA